VNTEVIYFFALLLLPSQSSLHIRLRSAVYELWGVKLISLVSYYGTCSKTVSFHVGNVSSEFDYVCYNWF